MKSLSLFISISVIIICGHSVSWGYENKVGLKYFGYALVDAAWDDPSDKEYKINYIDEVSAYTNIADILVTSPNDNIEQRLYLMKEHKVKAILNIFNLLFVQTGVGGTYSGRIFSLRSDFKSRWNEFVKVNNLYFNKEFIQAFYIGEEPTWNGISYEDLRLASNFIKESILEVPILIIEAYPTIKQLRIPTSVDWVGFDHYFIKFPDTDRVFLNELALMKSKLTQSSQKIVLVMDAHHIKSSHGANNISEMDMKDIATAYYKLAMTDPKIIAIICYFWPSGFDDPDSKGSRSFPEIVIDEHIRIGKSITGK